MEFAMPLVTRRRTRWVGLALLAPLVAALLVGPTQPAQAAVAPGWLDDIYGAHGLAMAPGGSDHYSTDGAVDSSGRVLLLTPTAPVVTQIQITRLSLDGSPDQTFGTGGSTALPAGPTYTGAVSSGNGVYVVGIPATGNGVSLVRLSTAGVVDAGFGTNGLATVPIPAAVSPTSLARLDSGDVIVAAIKSVAPVTGYLAAVDGATGALDPGWNAGGATPGLISSTTDRFPAVANDGNTTVVLATATNGSAQLRRLAANGTPDATFGTAGNRALPSTFAGTGVDVGADGNYYAAGTDGVSASSPMAVVRVTPAGVLDGGFGVGGLARLTLSGCHPRATATAVSGSSVYVFGVHADLSCSNTGFQPIVARLSTAGALDPSFGAGGFVQLSDEQFGNRIISGLIDGGVQANGQPVMALRILASGDTTRAGAMRLNAESSAPNGAFMPLLPRRLLDTRTGNGAPQNAVGPGATISLTVSGRGGVPASGVGAVVLNVTAVAPSRSGYVTVWPTGQARPNASNLNHGSGATTANLVTVPLGTGGMVQLYNGSSGTVHLLADLAGYYRAGTATAAGAFTPLTSARVLDTRTTLGGHHARLGAQATLDLGVTGQGGVPSTNVSAVVLNVTAVSPNKSGYLTAYPSGTTRPAVSSLNYAAGETRANLVTARLGTNGHVVLFNGSSGTVDLLVDVAGYYLGGTPTEPGTFAAVTPTRVLDTRTGPGTPVKAGADLTIFSAGSADPWLGASALVMNGTVTQATRSGYLAFQGLGDFWGGQFPSSSISFAAGHTVANMVIPSGDTFIVHNGSSGTVQEIADLSGYFLP